MGMTWGIVIEPTREGLARWVAVVQAGLTAKLLVPVWSSSGDEMETWLIRRVGAEVETFELGGAEEILAELRLLRTSDPSYDDIGRRFDGYSVFLPDHDGVRRLPADFFETGATACGVSPLLALGDRTSLDIEFRTAGQVALYHGLPIEIRI